MLPRGNLAVNVNVVVKNRKIIVTERHKHTNVVALADVRVQRVHHRYAVLGAAVLGAAVFCIRLIHMLARIS